MMNHHFGGTLRLLTWHPEYLNATSDVETNFESDYQPPFWGTLLFSMNWKLDGGFKYFNYFHPDLGKWSNLTSIFFKRVGTTTSPPRKGAQLRWHLVSEWCRTSQWRAASRAAQCFVPGTKRFGSFGLMENNPVVGWEWVNFIKIFSRRSFWKEVVWRFFQDAGRSRKCLGCWNLWRVGEFAHIVWNWSSVPSHYCLSESLICAWDHCDKAKSLVIRHKTVPFQSCFCVSTPFSLEILHLALPYPQRAECQQ